MYEQLCQVHAITNKHKGIQHAQTRQHSAAKAVQGR